MPGRLRVNGSEFKRRPSLLVFYLNNFRNFLVDFPVPDAYFVVTLQNAF